MYDVEYTLTPQEEEVVFRIRQLISDDKETFVDDVVVSQASNIKVSGTIYELEEPKGYPTEIYINGTEYITHSGVSGVNILSYKYLKFNEANAIENGDNLVVIYDHFRNSDMEIIQTYDTSALTYLTGSCNLSLEDLSVDLLVLATAFILLTKDIHRIASEAVDIQDSDSEYRNAGAAGGGRYLIDLLKLINDNLLNAINIKMRCKMMSLPIFKVE